MTIHRNEFFSSVDTPKSTEAHIPAHAESLIVQVQALPNIHCAAHFGLRLRAPPPAWTAVCHGTSPVETPLVTAASSQEEFAP